MSSSFPFPSTIFFTGHDASGASRYIESPECKTLDSQGVSVGLIYRNESLERLVDVNGDADLKKFEAHQMEPGSVFSRPSVARVTIPPASGGPEGMHRTMTVDCCVILSGEVEHHLDSGETKLLKQGDMVFQRGVNHYWINKSKTDPVHIVGFSMPSKPIDGVTGYFTGSPQG